MSDYYNVPIDDRLLLDQGFVEDDNGRYEKIVWRNRKFFDVDRCEYEGCDRPIILCRELYLCNGSLQVHAVCSRGHQKIIKIKPAAKDFAKRIKLGDSVE